MSAEPRRAVDDEEFGSPQAARWMRSSSTARQASVLSPPMALTASNTFWPSARTPMTTSSELEFLAIMRSAAILPMLLRPAQHLLVRAAVDLTPRWLRTRLGLNGHGLHGWEADAIRQAGAFADRLVLESNPAVQACRRMRLPADYLYVRRSAVAVSSTGPFQQVT